MVCPGVVVSSLTAKGRAAEGLTVEGLMLEASTDLGGSMAVVSECGRLGIEYGS